jgi:hypothetical protein
MEGSGFGSVQIITDPDHGGPKSYGSRKLEKDNDTEYTECQAFYPVVRIGSAHPLTRSRVRSPLVQGVGSLAWGEGVGGLNSDEGTYTVVL